MRPTLRSALVSTSVFVVSVVIGVSIVAGANDRAVAVDLYLLFVGLALVGLGFWWLRRVLPTEPAVGVRDQADRRLRPEDRAAAVDDWEGILAAGARSGRAATTRLRPRLQAVTRARLQRRGVDLETDPHAAATLLGPEAWAIVDPSTPRTTGRRAPGLDPESVRRLVARLESL